MSGEAALVAWRAAASLAAPGLVLLLRRRVRRGKEVAERLGERRGWGGGERPPGRLIWLHAASVGETVSALPVLEALQEQGASVLVTTGTVSSAQLLAQRCPGVLHRFIPLDVPRWVGRFLDFWRPDAAAFVESELWPNLLLACQRRGLRVMLLNGRLSERSRASWARFPKVAGRVLGVFDQVWAQSAADAARFAALGARAVSFPGNLKFAATALPSDPTELARLEALLGAAPRWLAASTHPGEEQTAAAVHHRLVPQFPGLVTMIAPRHPERGAALADELGARRQGAGQDPAPGGIWIADRLGGLGLLYRLCPAVFVGKSLAGGGGQNPLEPARLGCALAAGPQMDNQAEAATALGEAGALTTVNNEAELAQWVGEALRDLAGARARGLAGQAAANADAGLPQRAADALLAMAG